MSGITTQEAIEALRALGLNIRVVSSSAPRSEATLKGIAMNPACKPETRAQALAELTARLAPPAPTAAPEAVVEEPVTA